MEGNFHCCHRTLMNAHTTHLQHQFPTRWWLIMRTWKQRTEGWRGWLAFYIARCFPSASILSNVLVPTYESQTSLLWTWNCLYHESESRQARLKYPIVYQPTVVSFVNANQSETSWLLFDFKETLSTGTVENASGLNREDLQPIRATECLKQCWLTPSSQGVHHFNPYLTGLGAQHVSFIFSPNHSLLLSLIQRAAWFTVRCLFVPVVIKSSPQHYIY